MDKYIREVEANPDEVKTKPNDNEIRVTTMGRMRSYITYATKKLQDGKCDEITLKAMGKAITKTVTIAEIIKRRIPNLHQVTQINSTLIQEKYAPKEEGLEPVFTTRHVSSILISLYAREPDTKLVGYQPPLSEDVSIAPAQMNTGPMINRPARGRNFRGRRGRGRNRGMNTKPFNNNSQQRMERNVPADSSGQMMRSQPQNQGQQQQPPQNQGQQQQSRPQNTYGGNPLNRGGGRGRRGRGGGRGRGRGGNPGGGRNMIPSNTGQNQS